MKINLSMFLLTGVPVASGPLTPSETALQILAGTGVVVLLGLAFSILGTLP